MVSPAPLPSERIDRFLVGEHPPTPCLALDLDIGDPIDFLSAGAFTASYASVAFNGFVPIRSYCL